MGRPHRGKLLPYACFACRKSFKRQWIPLRLDRTCLERWARELGVSDLLERALCESGA